MLPHFRLVRDGREPSQRQKPIAAGGVPFGLGRPQWSAEGRAAGSVDEKATFFDVLADHARRAPNRPALIPSGTEQLSFGQLTDRIKSIWDILRDGGVGYGSKVAIVLPSGLESVITTVAIASHATCVPLNPRLSQIEFERELTRIKLDALIIPDWLDSPVRAVAERGTYGVFEASQASPSPSEFKLNCRRRALEPLTDSSPISSRSPLLLLRTSATTGPAKLVPVTHGNMLDLAGKMAGWFRLTEEDRAACVLPTYYAAASKLNVIVPLLLGQGIVIPVGKRSERLTEWIHELEPTWFSAGPTFLQAVLDELRSNRERAPTGILRFLTSGSAHLPNRIREELEPILGCPVLEVYGISEAGVMAANPAPPAKRKAGTVGTFPKDELIIGDSAGLPLPQGERGEIFVRGPGLMPGYLGEVAGEGLQDGWFRTGDIGFIDDDGFLTLVGRVKEIINRGGEKISPIDVEQALLVHPSVREAVAFGVPHPRLGENVAAAVILHQGVTVSPLDLKRFLRRRLAAFKIPQRIEIVNSFAKNHTGKIARSEMAEVATNREHHVDPPEGPLESEILKIWQRLLQRSDIGIHDDFFESGGDSLLVVQMLLEVENLLGYRCPASALGEATTIRQLAAITEANVDRDGELVTKAKDGTGTPFFFCHGDYEARGFYAFKLAALLDGDQPVYLLHPPGGADESAKDGIAEMARLFLPRLLALQPEGDFELGGFCNGGLIAWEVAHQLSRAGRNVREVVLVDSLSLNSRALFRGLCRLTQGAAMLPWPKSFKRTLGHDVMPAVWRWTRESQGSVYGYAALVGQSLTSYSGRFVGPLKQAARPREWSVTLYRAMANYLPPKLDCAVFAISCRENANVFEWATNPWTALASGIDRAVIPGDHKTCATNHIEALAKTLNSHKRKRKDHSCK